MMGGRTNEQWIEQYASSHQHPANRFCHTIGIPMIAVSLPLFIVAIILRYATPALWPGFGPKFWMLPLVMFIVGWVFQFVGHAFEGKEPEFFHDKRFLLVGLRWWFAKIQGKA